MSQQGSDAALPTSPRERSEGAPQGSSQRKETVRQLRWCLLQAALQHPSEAPRSGHTPPEGSQGAATLSPQPWAQPSGHGYLFTPLPYLSGGSWRAGLSLGSCHQSLTDPSLGTGQVTQCTSQCSTGLLGHK